MSPMPRRQWPEIFWSRDYDVSAVSRAASAGEVTRIARGVYVRAALDARAVVGRNWQRIVAREFPGALVADASAHILDRDFALTAVGIVGGTRYRLNGFADGGALQDSFTSGAASATYSTRLDPVTRRAGSPAHRPRDAGGHLLQFGRAGSAG